MDSKVQPILDMPQLRSVCSEQHALMSANV
jgi:hypothetical protein